MKFWIRDNFFYQFFFRMKEITSWICRKYSSPSPHFIKWDCLIRNGIPDATWVETGTYLGATTRVLSRHSVQVYSIEPEPTLCANARKKFKRFSNVQILEGTSEAIFPELLQKISSNVNFWLDGHYSDGITFQGAMDTPIVEELKIISENLARFDKVVVLVDDIRCFDPTILKYSSYPSVDFLVQWAKENGLHWHIEHDIFIAKNF